MCRIIANVSSINFRSTRQMTSHFTLPTKRIIKIAFGKSYNFFFGTYSIRSFFRRTHRSEDEKIYLIVHFRSHSYPRHKQWMKKWRKSLFHFHLESYRFCTGFAHFYGMLKNPINFQLIHWISRTFSILILHSIFIGKNFQWKIAQCQASQSLSTSRKFIVNKYSFQNQSK